jgi:hypothetical protein
MKQYEAVIKVMVENVGFATLGSLDQEVLKVPGVEWKTKTPFASIRRIVQDNRFFFKIRPGLWALNSYKDRISPEILFNKTITKLQREIYDHSYFQGLLVEIGNLKKYDTFVPNQDKNKKFLHKTLGEVCSLGNFHQFGYEHFVRKAMTIDVCWFNVRKMPTVFFEVEYSADINNSLLKFVELQDYFARFFIVSNRIREKEYLRKISQIAFVPVKDRIQFMDFDRVSNWHTRTFELASIERHIVL